MKEFIDSVNRLFIERERLKKELGEVEDRIASALKSLGFSDLMISSIYGIEVPVERDKTES